MDYQIQPITRRCTATGRELKSGERYYTALLEQGPALVRQDFSTEAWQGPPAGAFSFWMGRVPEANEKARPRFDDEMLEECFHRLEGQADAGRINFRYVVALLLIRRKRLRLETTNVEAGIETLTVQGVKTGQRYEVVNPRLGDEEMRQVQAEVFQVLGWK